MSTSYDALMQFVLIRFLMMVLIVLVLSSFMELIVHCIQLIE